MNEDVKSAKKAYFKYKFWWLMIFFPMTWPFSLILPVKLMISGYAILGLVVAAGLTILILVTAGQFMNFCAEKSIKNYIEYLGLK